MRIEWLRDIKTGALYVGAAGDHRKLYINGIVLASKALNAEAYAKLEKSANRSDKAIGEARI